jgi:hypothetical protein
MAYAAERKEATRELQGLEEPPYAREEDDWTVEMMEWPIGYA